MINAVSQPVFFTQQYTVCAFHANELRCTSSLLIAGKNSNVWMHHSLFNESFIGKPLCCFTVCLCFFFCYKQCFNDSSSLYTLHLIYTMYLPQSSPQGDNTDQMLCTFNILVLVNKLCCFLKVFPSISSSRSSCRALRLVLQPLLFCPLDRKST